MLRRVRRPVTTAEPAVLLHTLPNPNPREPSPGPMTTHRSSNQRRHGSADRGETLRMYSEPRPLSAAVRAQDTHPGSSRSPSPPTPAPTLSPRPATPALNSKALPDNGHAYTRLPRDRSRLARPVTGPSIRESSLLPRRDQVPTEQHGTPAAPGTPDSSGWQPGGNPQERPGSRASSAHPLRESVRGPALRLLCPVNDEGPETVEFPGLSVGGGGRI